MTKYSDKTTIEWKRLETFYNTKYKGNLTLPEFLDLDNLEWDKFENHFSNPKDIGIDEKDLPFPLGTKLLEFKYVDGYLTLVDYIFGTNPILVDLKRYNKELFLDRNLAEKELNKLKVSRNIRKVG